MRQHCCSLGHRSQSQPSGVLQLPSPRPQNHGWRRDVPALHRFASRIFMPISHNIRFL
jgi:hypothetical protein